MKGLMAGEGGENRRGWCMIMGRHGWCLCCGVGIREDLACGSFVMVVRLRGGDWGNGECMWDGF